LPAQTNGDRPFDVRKFPQEKKEHCGRPLSKRSKTGGKNWDGQGSLGRAVIVPGEKNKAWSGSIPPPKKQRESHSNPVWGENLRPAYRTRNWKTGLPVCLDPLKKKKRRTRLSPAHTPGNNGKWRRELEENA